MFSLAAYSRHHGCKNYRAEGSAPVLSPGRDRGRWAVSRAGATVNGRFDNK